MSTLLSSSPRTDSQYVICLFIYIFIIIVVVILLLLLLFFILIYFIFFYFLTTFTQTFGQTVCSFVSILQYSKFLIQKNLIKSN